MTATHTLKTWPEFFDAIVAGEKTFELRRDDRGFNVGDLLQFREWDPTDPGFELAGCDWGPGFTGREARFIVSYVLRSQETMQLLEYGSLSSSLGIEPRPIGAGWCVLGLAPVAVGL